MTLNIVQASKFTKDVKRCEKRGLNMKKLKVAIMDLAKPSTLQFLASKYKDRPLTGEWAGYRDLHISPDWILIYKIIDDELRLARTGTHSNLFG